MLSLLLGSSRSSHPDGYICCAAEAEANLQSPESVAELPPPQPLLLPPPPGPKAASAETQADTLSESSGQEVGIAAFVYCWCTEAGPGHAGIGPADERCCSACHLLAYVKLGRNLA